LDIVLDDKLTIQAEPLVNMDISKRDAWMKPAKP
jgi:hypothetical protein